MVRIEYAVLKWNMFSKFGNEAGESKKWAGVHFEESVEDGTSYWKKGSGGVSQVVERLVFEIE